MYIDGSPEHGGRQHDKLYLTMRCWTSLFRLSRLAAPLNAVEAAQPTGLDTGLKSTGSIFLKFGYNVILSQGPVSGEQVVELDTSIRPKDLL